MSLLTVPIQTGTSVNGNAFLHDVPFGLPRLEECVAPVDDFQQLPRHLFDINILPLHVAREAGAEEEVL